MLCSKRIRWRFSLILHQNDFKLEKHFQYKEAVEAYKAAAAIGEGCQIGLDSGWQGLIMSYWLVLQQPLDFALRS